MVIAKLPGYLQSASRALVSLPGRFSKADVTAAIVLLLCFLIYLFLGWKASGAETRWQLDVVDGITVFYGDDAYRYFLAKSAWIDPDIALQGFVLPVALALDGILALFTGGSLVLMRSAHALIAVLSIWMLYLAGRRLKVSAVIMLAASLVLALMPLYAYVSLSFYGEFWLSAAICVACWALISRRLWVFAGVISLMPLLRPEGFYFLFMGAIFLAVEKRTRQFLMACIPGGIYFFVLMLSDNGLQGSFYWRAELRQFLNMIEFSSNPLAMLNTYNNIWLFGGMAGLFLKSARPLWPFSVATIFWIFLVFSIVYFKLGDYEPRYTVPALPVIAMGWALLLAWFSEKLKGLLSGSVVKPVVVLLCAFVLFENLLQLHAVNQISAYYGSHSKLPDFSDSTVQNALFLPRKDQEIEDAQFMADFATHLIEENPRINTLVISDVFLFYFLDPARLGSEVNIAYSATYWPFFRRLIKGEIMAVFPQGNHYGYFSLAPPREDSAELLLYADFIAAPEHQVGWARGRHQLHLFEYHLSLQPKVDFRDKPAIDPLSIPQHEMTPFL
ncbi:glycosyltransferase family 39 protein [Alcanivorax sp. 1008]|uniref:glycosyltransferase family 39 protein n=1 Tax=Alcanivorax sp. 1008 TaxID=2816853 RepID=UPI001D6ECD5D|nr:glycosyltransferase family 39 protein [Alcanivorax sp. 1008]MCC1498071.1 hypothetical protein [Alcanivorax sp. 1008]